MQYKIISILCLMGVVNNAISTIVPQEYLPALDLVNALANTITLIVAGIIAYFIKAGIAQVNARLEKLEKGQRRMNFRMKKLEGKDEHI